MNPDQPTHADHNSGRLFNWILVGFFLVASYFLIAEHKAHLSGILYYLPFLLLLACPLMHVFMHHGHGSHGKDAQRKGAGGENQ